MKTLSGIGQSYHRTTNTRHAVFMAISHGSSRDTAYYRLLGIFRVGLIFAEFATSVKLLKETQRKINPTIRLH